jgi:hypothetical protein
MPQADCFSPGYRFHSERDYLSVYDILGRQVSVSVNEKKEAGVHEVEFSGSALASGVYLYRLTTGSFTQTRKMIVVK